MTDIKCKEILEKLISQSDLNESDQNELCAYLDEFAESNSKKMTNKSQRMKVIFFSRCTESVDEFCNKIISKLDSMFDMNDYSFDTQWQLNEFDTITGCICTVFYHG